MKHLRPKTRSLGLFTLLCVALVLFFLGLMIVPVWSMYLLRIMLGHYHGLFLSLDRRIKELTSLAVSKDLETYRNLTAIHQMMENPTQTSAFSEANVVPMDDQTMAARLAEVYKQHGMDPSVAYDNPLDDFGGAGAFM